MPQQNIGLPTKTVAIAYLFSRHALLKYRCAIIKLRRAQQNHSYCLQNRQTRLYKMQASLQKQKRHLQNRQAILIKSLGSPTKTETIAYKIDRLAYHNIRRAVLQYKSRWFCTSGVLDNDFDSCKALSNIKVSKNFAKFRHFILKPLFRNKFYIIVFGKTEIRNRLIGY